MDSSLLSMLTHTIFCLSVFSSSSKMELNERREKKEYLEKKKKNQRGCARPDSSSMSSTMMISFSIEMDANHMHRLSNKEIERQSEQ